MKVNIRTITVGSRHAEPGDPSKVATYHRWLLENPYRAPFPVGASSLRLLSSREHP